MFISNLNNLKSIIQDDVFLGNYLLTIGLAILIDWLLLPYFTKIMGLYIPLVLISVYYIITELSGYINLYLDNVHLDKIILILIILDTIQFIILFIYFINIEIFAYLLMVIFSLQAMLYEIYTIKIISFIENKKLNYIISNIHKITLYNKTNMVFLGLIITTIYSVFFIKFDYMILFIISLMLISLYREIRLYTYIKTI